MAATPYFQKVREKTPRAASSCRRKAERRDGILRRGESLQEGGKRFQITERFNYSAALI